MVTLPHRFLNRHTLECMNVGDERYTLPWGMWVDANMNCWLHPQYPAEHEPGGTVQMRVERREDGFHVWPPSGETYQPSACQPYISPDDTPWIEVAEVH
jgi:hypothetical protein